MLFIHLHFNFVVSLTCLVHSSSTSSAFPLLHLHPFPSVWNLHSLFSVFPFLRISFLYHSFNSLFSGLTFWFLPLVLKFDHFFRIQCKFTSTISLVHFLLSFSDSFCRLSTKSTIIFLYFHRLFNFSFDRWLSPFFNRFYCSGFSIFFAFKVSKLAFHSFLHSCLASLFCHII